MLNISSILTTYGKDNPTFTRWGEYAELVRQEIRFIGRKEFDIATKAIAMHWAEVFRTLPEDKELFVFVRQQESSAYVYDAVDTALSLINPDYANRVIPITWSSLEGDILDRIKDSGIFVLDDWAISGSQMSGVILNLLNNKIPNEKIQLNFICAPQKYLEEGFMEVDCRSYYNYPCNYDPKSEYYTTLTGAHSDTDYGFREQIKKVMGDLRRCAQKLRVDPNIRHGYEGISYPLLYTIVRSYDGSRTTGLQRQIAPDESGLLDEIHQRFVRLSDRFVLAGTAKTKK